MEVCYRFCYSLFCSVTAWVAEPKVSFLQTLNAEPIQIVVTHSLVLSPKLHPLSSAVTFNYSLSSSRSSFSLFGFFSIIYTYLFCVYLLSATVQMLSQCVQSFSSHCWCAFSCAFDACVWGGWTKAMCLVRSHTNVVSPRKSHEQQTIKCTKCALWVTDLPHHHQHLA